MIPLDRDLLYEVEELDELKLVNDRPSFRTTFETSRPIERIKPPLPHPSILYSKENSFEQMEGGGKEESFVQLNCALRNKPPRFGLRESFDL